MSRYNNMEEVINKYIKDIEGFIDEVRPQFLKLPFIIHQVKQTDPFYHDIALRVKHVEQDHDLILLINLTMECLEIMVGHEPEEVLNGEDFWRFFYLLNMRPDFKNYEKVDFD